MKSNNKRKGIWIPIELIENKKLDWANKALLSEIYSLHKQEKGCIASDQHFATLLGFKNASTAQKRVDTLVELKLIRKKVVYKNRKIIGKILTPISPKNDSTDQEEQTNSSKETNGVVPEQSESSSSESNEVVPQSRDNSSPKNTKNSFKNSLENNSSGPLHGPIQKSGEVEESSFSFLTLGINNPDDKNEFLEAYKEYSNASKYSDEKIQKDMEYICQDLPNWQSTIEKLGRDKFIDFTAYSYNNIAGAKGMVAAFIDRLFQPRTK